ncbi:MAG: DUF885 domain-containing protein [Gemmatimonadaceae bacterium]|nr:DUF885 domain-containing protein [Gemmatimonadaceae bacterium]
MAGTILGAIALLASSACAIINPRPLVPTPADSALARALLDEALTTYWRHELPRNHELALANGLGVSLLPDVSSQGRKADLRTAQSVTNALDRVNVAALSQGDYVTSLALRWEMDAQAEAVAFSSADFSFLSPAASPVRTLSEIYRLQPMASTAGAERYLYFVEAMAFVLDRMKLALEERRVRGYVAPRETVESALAFYRSLRALGPNGPWALSPERLAPFDSASREVIVREASLTLSQRVYPALDDFVAYLDSAYLPIASSRAGLWQYPGGKELYRHLLRRHSSLDVPPEEAHRVGLGELRRIDSTLALLRAREHWNPGARAFQDSLRLTMVAPSSLDAVRNQVEAHLRRLEKGLEAQFAEAPARDATIRAASPAEALLWPDGTYLPASMAAEVGELLLTDRWRTPAFQAAIASRTYRALVPGRHLEAAMTRGNPAVPAFRRHLETPGYSDGWAQYAASLAGEMGMYAAPLDAYGRLLDEGASIAYLVIDTGIHYLGWSLPQARAVLGRYVLAPDALVDSLVTERVINDPGRAGAGALGAREVAAMRAWMQGEQGKDFSAPAWHHEVLSLGEVPLPIVGSHLEWWLYDTARQRASALAAEQAAAKAAAEKAAAAKQAAGKQVPAPKKKPG